MKKINIAVLSLALIGLAASPALAEGQGGHVSSQGDSSRSQGGGQTMDRSISTDGSVSRSEVRTNGDHAVSGDNSFMVNRDTFATTDGLISPFVGNDGSSSYVTGDGSSNYVMGDGSSNYVMGDGSGRFIAGDGSSSYVTGDGSSYVIGSEDPHVIYGDSIRRADDRFISDVRMADQNFADNLQFAVTSDERANLLQIKNDAILSAMKTRDEAHTAALNLLNGM